MFDLGNGIWVAAEFITMVSITKEADRDQVWEYVTVSMLNNGYSWRIELNDQRVIAPFTDGLLTLGYASCEDFCTKLLAAIKEAKA